MQLRNGMKLEKKEYPKIKKNHQTFDGFFTLGYKL